VLRITAAAVVVAHGLIHLVGFLLQWGIATVDGLPSSERRRTASGSPGSGHGVADASSHVFAT